eukprot:14702198-Alexandrium_andersonii.AAC.1
MTSDCDPRALAAFANFPPASQSNRDSPPASPVLPSAALRLPLGGKHDEKTGFRPRHKRQTSVSDSRLCNWASC